MGAAATNVRNKRQAALSTAPGMYAEDDPSTVIFETSTKLKVEKNRWVLMSFVMGSIAAGAVWTCQPLPRLRAWLAFPLT
jgi:type IV secretion system protein VirB5